MTEQLAELDEARQRAKAEADAAWYAYVAAQRAAEEAYAAWWLARFGEPYPLYRKPAG